MIMSETMPIVHELRGDQITILYHLGYLIFDMITFNFQQKDELFGYEVLLVWKEVSAFDRLRLAFIEYST